MDNSVPGNTSSTPPVTPPPATPPAGTPPPATPPPAANTPTTPTPPAAPKKGGGKLLMVLIIILVLAAVGAAAAYFLMRQNAANEAGNNVINTLPTTAPTATPEPTQATDSAVLGIIDATITTQDYEALVPLMSPEVTVLLYASECCGSLTAEEAASQLSYLESATVPWNWDQADSVIADIKSNQPDTFGKGTVGISANDYVASFVIEDELITEIYLSGTSSLLLN